MWNDVDVQKIQACIRNRSEYDRVFPSFFIELGKRVHSAILKECPGATKWDGPYSRDILLEIDPALKDPIYADWVCFGIEGYRPDQAHIGVMFDVKHYPVTYNVGIHAHDFVLARNEVEIYKKRSRMGDPFVFVYEPVHKEYKFQDLDKELDLADLEDELDRIAARSIELYFAFNGMLKK
jgi:hypothetical protein